MDRAARQRLARHRRLEQRTRARLRRAHGQRFDVVRAELLELVACVDPLVCDHVPGPVQATS